MDDTELHLEITADATQALGSIGEFSKSIGFSDEAIAGLEKMLGELTAQLGITTDALGKATVAHTAHGNAAEREEGKLALLARQMSAVGLSAAALPARLDAATGALGKMGAELPGLIALGGGLVAVFEGFKFLEHGVEVAKQFEGSMETLRAAVEAQGGSWGKAAGEIQKFLDVESQASGFTQNELVGSLNRLVTAGASVRDSMKIVSVAEEEAVARHSDVLSVVNLLISAESGRAQGLVKLDPRLRAIIKSHGDLADILKALHDLNKKQLDDDSSLERADGRRQAAFDAAAKTLGQDLLPYLVDLDYMLIGALKNAEEFGQGFSTVISGVTDGLSQAIRAASDLANALAHPGLAGGFLSDAMSAARTASLDNQKAESGFSDIINFGHEDPYSYGRNAAKHAVQQHNSDIGNVGSLDFEPELGSGIKSANAGLSKTIGLLGQVGKGFDVINTKTFLPSYAGDGVQKVLDQISDAFLVTDNKIIEDAKNAAGEHSAAYRQALQKEINDLQTWLEAHKDADAKLVKLNQDTLDKRKAEAATYDSWATQQAQQQYDKITQAIGTLADKGVQLFNSLFTAGKNGAQSFGQVFKSMIDDIVSYLEKSAITSLLMSIFHVPALGPDGKPQSNGSGGWFSAVLGLGGLVSTTSPASANPNIAGDPAFGFGALNNPMAVAGGIGADGSLAFGNGQYGVPNIAGAAGAQLPGGALGNFLKGGWGAHIGGAGTATFGGAALAAAGGALLGQTLFQGRGYADMGGAIGGLGAALLGSKIGIFAGPWGALLGGLIGAGFGSLFGNHFNPADEPDINKTQEWGQWLADLQGKTSGNPMNANGQQFVMDSQTSSSTKNKGWNIVMEDFVAKFRGKEDQLPASLKGVFKDISDLWGGAQGQADFNGDGKDGNLDIGSGKRANYATFWQYITGYGQQIADLMANYSPTQTYAASMQGAVSGIGVYTPDGNPMILHDFPDTGAPGSYSAPPSGGPAPTPPGGGGGYTQPPGGRGYNPPGGGGNQAQTVIQNITNVYQNVHGNIMAQSELDRSASEGVARFSLSSRASRQLMGYRRS